jgi:phosphoribosylamine---glycine ligase
VRVLVVGSGGREHALVWSFAREGNGIELHAAPGNPGIAELAHCHPVRADDPSSLVPLAVELGVDLVVVGPEAPLVAGLADALRRRGIAVFGPNADAARIEGSKTFAKDVMGAARVPTAALLPLAQPPCVVKADGLAAGKGVTVAADPAEAQQALREIFVEHRFGDGGASAIVEERLQGTELSLLALCDGRTAVPLAPARDFKRIGDGDQGANTGGMGAYSPVAGLSDSDVVSLCCFLQQPIVDWMRERGTPYHGVLYAGLMLTVEGPRVLEFNVRFGDPEAQAVLPRMESHLLDLLMRSLWPGGLSNDDPTQPLVWWSPDWATTVVLASAGYPASSSSGDPIAGVQELPEEVELTHAGTRLNPDGALATAGGRVLNLTGFGPDAKSARESAYSAAGMISFAGMQLRSDIAAAADERSLLPQGAAPLAQWFAQRAEGRDDPDLEASMDEEGVDG